MKEERRQRSKKRRKEKRETTNSGREIEVRRKQIEVTKSKKKNIHKKISMSARQESFLCVCERRDRQIASVAVSVWICL